MREYGAEVSIDDAVYVDGTAQLYGKIRVEEGASVWPQVVMRAEMYEISVGPYSNIQDFVMVHVGYATPTIVGAYCSITHHVTLHGCTIGDNCLIGINATIMDGCTIGDNCIVGGNSLLTEGTVVPDNSIVMGVPGKVVKTRDNFVANRANALLYYYNALGYARGDHRVWSDPDILQRIQKEAAAMERTRAGEPPED
jgi:carbonic anhydrase/acetyltransferase-like protein (isoleucine patch superfamily)